MIDRLRIPLKRLDPDLPMPRHAHAGDGGVDLYARERVTLGLGEFAAVPTGVAAAVPEGFVGLITPRSGLAARHGMSLVNTPGILDSGYRGEIKALLINHGPHEVTIERGDRIAQLVVVPVVEQVFVEVDELPESDRGAGGFGSTGS
jgi:dUTP pyrophosphatase